MAITAQYVVARIRQNFASSWLTTPVDDFIAGKPETEVTGIATTYAPSLEVLKKAVAARKNFLISRESPFWARMNAAGGGTQFQGLPGNWPNGQNFTRQEAGAAEDDPTLKAKRDYIAANNLVVYRLFANWNAQPVDLQLKGLAKALGWEKYYKPSATLPAWSKYNGYFEIPPVTLKEAAIQMKKTLGSKSIRIGGNPDTVVHKAALSHGMYWLPDLQKWYAEPGVDLLVVGEPQWENEISLYSFDVADSGQKKGYIVLGQQVSEEPGCAEMAAWLKPLVPEVTVEHISAGEPCWMPY